MRIDPFGKNAMLHGCTNPFVMTNFNPRSTPVSNVTDPSGIAGDGQLIPFGVTPVLDFAFALSASEGC
jgi:hypothetical protein